MSKKNTPKNPQNSVAPKKTGFFSAVGGFALSTLKVTGIVAVICGLLFVILLNVSRALTSDNRPSADDIYTIKSVNVESNSVNLENADGVLEVYLLGIVLNEEAPESDFAKYIGAEVTLETEIMHGRYTEGGMRQAYIIVLQTEHVLQLDMMVDGVAFSGPLDNRAELHDEFWECATFGVYPEG